MYIHSCIHVYTCIMHRSLPSGDNSIYIPAVALVHLLYASLLRCQLWYTLTCVDDES